MYEMLLGTDPSDIVYDHDAFAVHTQVARMLATEDIIVRWNVKGMDCPASMNFATRVLDIAPIKKEKINTIPGLILHEVGHFIGSKNVGSSKDGKHSVDVDELEAFTKKIENHSIWNIIEDGYIERLVVARWPGALKHLRVLYENNLASYKESSGHNIILQIINTLHINVLGVKWGEHFDYPAKTPADLLPLLYRARLIMGTYEDRADLSTQIANNLKKLLGKCSEKHAKKEIQQELVNDDAIGDSSVIINPSVELNNTINDFLEQSKVDTALRSDLIEKSVKPEGTADTKIDIESDSEKKEDVESQSSVNEEIESSDNDALAEFISDNKAAIIASNEARIKSLVDKSAEATSQNNERHIPSYNELMQFSNVKDIIDDDLNLKLKGISFHRFQQALSNSDSAGRDVKRGLAAFNSKLMKARVIARALFQRFSTKANAMNVSLTRYKQTGSLDPTRAALYKIYDDIFQKKQQAPNQINHGYIIMVDWSSSMGSSALELFHRVIELVAFAQLAKVELDVWLYTTDDTISAVDKNKIQDGVLYLCSKFVHVLNTKKHVGDAINYRLFALFINALCAKSISWGYSDNMFVRGAESLLGGINFAKATRVGMSGTNILEAMIFAKHHAQKLTSDRKAIMLLTDGEDNNFEGVYFSTPNNCGSLWLSALNHDDRVMYGGNINLVDVSKKLVQLFAERSVNKYDISATSIHLKTVATFMVAEEARKEGISVIGVTWGISTSRHMALWSKNNIIRVDVPWNNMRSKSINLYTEVKNDFIFKITEALLANIKA